MSGENKTLKETIAEGIKTEPAVDTKKGMSQDDATGETKTGGTPVYASGVDISDIPEQDRPRITELLSKKASLLEKGYQGKFQKVAQLEKINDELASLGVDANEARDVILKHVETKKNPQTTQKKDALNKLDTLIANAPYEQQQALKDMRDIIQEETEIPALRKQIQDLTNAVNNLSGVSNDTRKERLNAELTDLKDKYGSDIIEKYQDAIIAEGVKYPKLSARKLLQIIASDDDVEQAVLFKGKKLLTPEKKNAISSTGEGVTTATEKIDIKNRSLKDIILDAAKLKR